MKTILIVEDHASLRRNLAELLSLEGYRTVEAADGLAGLERLRAEPVDLVLCDLMMPNLDGFGLLARVRANPATAGLPFVFLTARGEMPSLREGMAAGADDYLAKPVAKEDLLLAVRVRLERHLQQQASAPLHFDDPRRLERLGLTPREAEVLLWLAQGKSNGEIGVLCQISVGTVKKHVNHILVKLGVENRSGAVLSAVEALTGRV